MHAPARARHAERRWLERALVALLAMVTIACGAKGEALGRRDGGGGGDANGDAISLDVAADTDVREMPGVWQNVTPAGINLQSPSGNNVGVQDVLVDPARPGDFYAFVSLSGVWRSTDFGRTWNLASAGTGRDVFEAAKPWTAAIDRDRARDPSASPTLYVAFGGVAQRGLLRSTDFGVNWTEGGWPTSGPLASQAIYGLDVDPYDPRHLIASMGGNGGFAESVDGGDTWQPAAGNVGDSNYVFFVDTGNAATTRTTWLAIAQTGPGLSRTTDAGAQWTTVAGILHATGCSQMVQTGGGVMYIAGADDSTRGVYRSTDYGATWINVVSGDANTLVATATTIYSSYSWAGLNATPAMFRSPRNEGTTWSALTAPPSMTNGWKGAAATFDGTHHIIVGGHWTSGLWRYVEP